MLKKGLLVAIITIGFSLQLCPAEQVFAQEDGIMTINEDEQEQPIESVDTEKPSEQATELLTIVELIEKLDDMNHRDLVQYIKSVVAIEKPSPSDEQILITAVDVSLKPIGLFEYGYSTKEKHVEKLIKNIDESTYSDKTKSTTTAALSSRLNEDAKEDKTLKTIMYIIVGILGACVIGILIPNTWFNRRK